MMVYVACVNDRIIGIYRKKSSAELCLSTLRKRGDAQWQSTTPGYYVNRDGIHMRMAVEQFEVK